MAENISQFIEDILIEENSYIRGKPSRRTITSNDMILAVVGFIFFVQIPPYNSQF